MSKKKPPKGYRLQIRESNHDPIMVTWDYTMYLEKWIPKRFLRKARWKVVAYQRLGWIPSPHRVLVAQTDMINMAVAMRKVHREALDR